MSSAAKPKATSFEYGPAHQQAMLSYYHESKRASEENTEHLRVRLAHDLVNRYALPRLGKPPQQITLVDVGCSVGLFAIEFSKEGFNSFGVDFDPAALEIARKLCEEERASATFYQMDVADFDSEMPIDIALCFDVFEHLHDDELGAMLVGIKRRLSERGCLVFHTLPLQYDYLFWNQQNGRIEFPPVLRPFRSWPARRFTRLTRLYAMALDWLALARGRLTHQESIKMDGHCNPLTRERVEDILARAGYEVVFIESGFLGDSQLDPRDREHFHRQPVTHRSLRGVAAPRRT
ncbi:MAG TPA: class I SAM-dependent methyltransferase [Pyrinomonadaceae bacterium]|nr:class I SAM-dependent methyltransferase [Pyrinomonadaceae bacterium]